MGRGQSKITQLWDSKEIEKYLKLRGGHLAFIKKNILTVYYMFTTCEVGAIAFNSNIRKTETLTQKTLAVCLEITQ